MANLLQEPLSITRRRLRWALALVAVAVVGWQLSSPVLSQTRAKRDAGGRIKSNEGPGEVPAGNPADAQPAKKGLEELLRPDAPAQPPAAIPGLPNGFQPEQMLSPGGLSSTLNMMVLLTVLSLAPSILMMTTCFVRFLVVFGLARQAMGTQQLPPNQVLIALSLFMTFSVMAPVWQQSYEQGIVPYTHPAPGQAPVTLEQTFQNSVRPVRRFMSDQIEKTGNSETVWMFLDFQKTTVAGGKAPPPETYDEVPLTVLLPAYLLSELKTAFIIGFQLYLPFLVIDMVVSSILMSMGMMMLPPTLISMPFKLLLFVLIDGWQLMVGMMLESVRML